MTYLQRIIQRLSAKQSDNMLLPNINIWSGVIDPFENTGYLPPEFPRSKERQGIKRTVADQPLPPPPAKQLPVETHRSSTESPQPASTINHDESIKHRTPADIIAPRKKYPEKHSSSKAVLRSETGSTPVSEPGQNSNTEAVHKQQQNNLSPRQPPPAMRWETRWLRRYVCDTATAFEVEKFKSLNEGVAGRKTLLLSPRQKHVSAINENVAKPTILTGSKSIRRSALKQRQPKEPRLVIGQLTVDVVPVKPANTPHRRKRTLKKRAEDRRSKLSQAETARFGFGIGQM